MFFFLTKIILLFFMNIFISIGLVNLHILIYYVFLTSLFFFFFKKKIYINVGTKLSTILTILYNVLPAYLLWFF